MKKTILSSLLMMVALSVFAATPTTWTNVVTVKLIDGNSDNYTSRFGEATELTDQPSWGAAVANLEGATVRAYTILNGEKYEKLYLQSMENTALVVKTYNSTSLSFELKANYGTITLYDKLTGNTKTVDKAGVAGLETDTYDCTVETNATIEGRFFLFYNAAHFYKVTTNAYGWASYSNDVDVVLSNPAGLKIYTGAFDGVQTLNLTEVDYVAADEGVIVYGAPGTTYYFAAGTGSSVYGTNHLKPASAFTVGDQNVFVLNGEALYEYVGTDPIPANKAYLQLPGGSNNAPRRISMHIDGTTAIENVEVAAPVEKFMENGQVLIKRGEAVYNLQGQMVK